MGVQERVHKGMDLSEMTGVTKPDIPIDRLNYK